MRQKFFWWMNWDHLVWAVIAISISASVGIVFNRLDAMDARITNIEFAR